MIVQYVDNVLIASQDVNFIRKVSDHISKHFEVRDFDEVRQCLGIDFHREGDVINLNLSGHIDEILSRFGMENFNSFEFRIE